MTKEHFIDNVKLSQEELEKAYVFFNENEPEKSGGCIPQNHFIIRFANTNLGLLKTIVVGDKELWLNDDFDF